MARSVGNVRITVSADQDRELVPRTIQATEASARDLVTGASPPIEKRVHLEITDGHGSCDALVSMVFGIRRAGFGIYTADSDSDLIASIASGLQDAFIEEFMTTSPLCPGHSHPLSARAHGKALWECPQDPAYFSCAIGTYGESILQLPGKGDPYE